MLRRAGRPSAASGRDEEPPVHVTVPGHGGRKRQRGIALHRSSTLTRAHCTLHDGIPITKPGRTIADLRPVLSEAELAAAIREAEFLRLPLGDGPWFNRAGNRPSPSVRSELEAQFMALVRRHRLPRPEVNVQVDRHEVDFLWRDQRLVVEVDGWKSHRTRSAFEEDRARDARLKLLGFEVLRLTWRQIESDSAMVAATIRALLARGT
jgi:very-short-patch-repair endonuclease